MRIINKLIRYINRKRHSAGHGVHSQFAYELIMDTIHTPYSYYSYQDNKTKLQQAQLDKDANIKYAELLFRLVNRFNCRKILEIGSGKGVNTLYLISSSKEITITCVEQEAEKSNNALSLLANKQEKIILTDALPVNENSFDAIVWDLKHYPYKKEVLETIPHIIKKGGFVVINSINKGKENKEIWQSILQLNSITMSFDLGAIGIGFFKPTLPKLNYDIYFKS